MGGRVGERDGKAQTEDSPLKANLTIWFDL